VHSRELVAGYRRIANLSNQEIERRLEDAPQDVPIKDLAVVAGMAAPRSRSRLGRSRTVNDRGSGAP
jgi:hypothetical protein